MLPNGFAKVESLTFDMGKVKGGSRVTPKGTIEAEACAGRVLCEELAAVVKHPESPAEDDVLEMRGTPDDAQPRSKAPLPARER